MKANHLFAIVFASAVIFHIVGAFARIDSASASRHVIFAGIDIVCAWGFLARPRLFPWCFPLLVVAQIFSHGGHMAEQYRISGSLNWLDACTLIFLGMAQLFLLRKPA